MNKLSKPKAFEASESITTPIGEIANLLRSGIKNQTVFLVGHAGKWHEIEIESLRISEEAFLENSHLESVAYYLDVHNITLADMYITAETAQITGLTHEDFMSLSEKYPAFSYIQISQLNDHNISKGKKASIDVLNDDLKMLTRDEISIQEYITPTWEEVTAVSDNGQSEIIGDTVPVPVPVDSVSISIFENLSPAKITEIQIIRSEQEAIVAKNPVITITDKTTYNQAKKNLAILLSASTRINGTKGVFTLAKQFVNKFKSDFDAEGLAIEQLSRVPHDAQKKLIQDWDNRLLLQQQERIKQLCAVPFVFDGTSYGIGSLVVTQKDIEDHTEEQWIEIIKQGEAVALAIEAAKNIQNAEIEELKKQNAILLERLNALLPKEEIVGQVEHAADVFAIPTTSETETYTREGDILTIIDTHLITETQFTPIEYELPSPENKLLNALDLAHLSEIESPEYLTLRAGYVSALSDVAKELQSVFDNPDDKILKSTEIKKLIAIWQ